MGCGEKCLSEPLVEIITVLNQALHRVPTRVAAGSLKLGASGGIVHDIFPTIFVLLVDQEAREIRDLIAFCGRKTFTNFGDFSYAHNTYIVR